MPIPKVVGRLNKVGANRITKRIAPELPGLGVVVHRGRRSGKVYETPVNVFSADDGYVLALTYGPDTDWVKNILAAGDCELRTQGRKVHLTAPHLYHDESRSAVGPFARPILRVIGVADFLSLKPAPDSAPDSASASGQPAQ